MYSCISCRTLCSCWPFCLILQGFYFWEAWGGACRVPHQQNKEVAALRLCAEKIRVVLLPGLRAVPSSGSPAVERGSNRRVFFFEKEPGFAFVSRACLLGYLNVKHSSNSSCILAQDFGKLTELKGKTKCSSCKLITVLFIFLLIRRALLC